VESKNGFIDYAMYDDGSMYIFTLFVSKEARNEGEGAALEEHIIKKEKPQVIFCDIDKDSNNWELALNQIMKKAGYEIYQDKEDQVVLWKVITKNY
jgi:hypothetical protein